MKRSFSAAIFAICFLITISPPAYADPALGDIFATLPPAGAIAAYQWLVRYYWWLVAATALTWVWYVITGRSLLTRLIGDRERDGILDGSPDVGNSLLPRLDLHVQLSVLLALATVYILACSVLISPKYLSLDDRSAKNTALSKTAVTNQPEAQKNPARGPWPEAGGYLNLPLLANNGHASIEIINTVCRYPVNVKLCASADLVCPALRHFYLPTNTSMSLENLPDGDYQLRYIETRTETRIETRAPQNVSATGMGKTRIFQIRNGKAWHETFRIPLSLTQSSSFSNEDFFLRIALRFERQCC